MAQVALRLPENAAGDFYVDESCIDCAVCRQVAPGTFAPSPRGYSYVHAQPDGPGARHRALMALVACPTASIGTVAGHHAGEAVRSFPEPVAPGVSFCGFASESSYGASSYLVEHPQGNVLVDSPRAAEPLLRALEARGGVSLLFLSHRDDVADHQRFHDRFGCPRVLHERDRDAGTRDIEQPLRGDDPVALRDGLLAIPVPGHTAGSAALLYEDTCLFTGDHLMGREDGTGLYASRSVCWHSWPRQLESLRRLLDYRFEWVLPGHGARYRAASPAAMRRELERLIATLPRA